MRLGFLIAVMTCLSAWPVRADYDFAIPEAQKKNYEIGGRMEFRDIFHCLDTDSARYRLNYYQDGPGSESNELRASVELSGSYRQGIFQANLLTHHEFVDAYSEDGWINDIYEGYVSMTPTAQVTLDAGKKSILWGKGYAWNPAGFINRPKDPDDPSLNLEGRTLLGIDLVKSYSGKTLTNIGLTALLLPVIDDWANGELGQDGDLVAACKLYLLWRDTDLDFICFDGPDQPFSLGFDFARNLAENIAIHGELAWRKDVSCTVLDASGQTRKTREDQLSYLAGVRYLNAFDTTFIAEYYHNGAGCDRGELNEFFAFQEAAFRDWQAGGDAAIMARADQLTRPYYQQRNFGQDYVYIKVSQKEPFDILYFNPWAAVIVNLQDWSFNLQPGLTWTPVTNLELNLRAGIPIGPANTEFGEKPDAFRPEFWVRYYF
ncbi:MAG: hypothetical protein PHD57_04115 [Desulfobacterales bacterium]|nr:hypothetical protein [Desulfobacterales bacterium]MDD3082458.1 hypothetical protein [Desulfobacterales bacterium]MDD3951935.1 hypothetical protein [Desulfobacterales bacterium]